MTSEVSVFSIFFVLLNLSVQVLSTKEDCMPFKKLLCNNMKRTFPVKILGIVSVIISSIIGVCLPYVARSFPALNPEQELFGIVKSFSAGVLLASGFMHVLADSFDMPSSNCLKNNMWHKFPFTGFVAMMSAILALLINSMASSFYSKKNEGEVSRDQEMAVSGGGDREVAMVADINFSNTE
ncbi:hypothetical protein ACJIZ3_019826 [Penstemon smallii]|uniref:Uncharacterized protein n=1 Tax=Penstemon smallii TaxID=265156 RepID=A0ABD3T286_9LAMI